MRRYYFDFLDDTALTRDHEGTEHPNEESALQEMHRALLEISQTAARPGKAWRLVGVLRDGRGDIWRGRLSFDLAAVSCEPGRDIAAQ